MILSFDYPFSSGDCINGKCVCDEGWTDPPDCIDSIGGCSTGPPCSYLHLAPADPALPGYKNDSWPSWGGHPQFWSKAKGGDDTDPYIFRLASNALISPRDASTPLPAAHERQWQLIQPQEDFGGHWITDIVEGAHHRAFKGSCRRHR